VTRRVLAVGMGLGAVLALALTVPTSGANLTAVRTNPGTTISADTPTRYLHAYSQSTDPTALTGYATKAGSSPVVAAATGTDNSIAVALGGYRNMNATLVSRVLVVAAPNPLPTGITSITVRLALAADATSGLQPITATAFAAANGTGTCAGATVTLFSGDRCQLNLTITTKVSTGFVNGSAYAPKLWVIVNFTGYSGNSFLDYPVPVAITT
jgi:hypothetical protein